MVRSQPDTWALCGWYPCSSSLGTKPLSYPQLAPLGAPSASNSSCQARLVYPLGIAITVGRPQASVAPVAPPPTAPPLPAGPIPPVLVPASADPPPLAVCPPEPAGLVPPLPGAAAPPVALPP